MWVQNYNTWKDDGFLIAFVVLKQRAYEHLYYKCTFCHRPLEIYFIFISKYGRLYQGFPKSVAALVQEFWNWIENIFLFNVFEWSHLPVCVIVRVFFSFSRHLLCHIWSFSRRHNSGISHEEIFTIQSKPNKAMGATVSSPMLLFSYFSLRL